MFKIKSRGKNTHTRDCWERTAFHTKCRKVRQNVILYSATPASIFLALFAVCVSFILSRSIDISVTALAKWSCRKDAQLSPTPGCIRFCARVTRDPASCRKCKTCWTNHAGHFEGNFLCLGPTWQASRHTVFLKKVLFLNRSGNLYVYATPRFITVHTKSCTQFTAIHPIQ